MQDRRVRGQTRDDLARALVLEISGVQAHETAKHRVAQIGADSLTEPGNEVEAKKSADRDRGGDQQNKAQGGRQRLRIAAGETAIDQQLQPLAQGQRRGCGEHKSQSGPRQAPSIRRQIRPESDQGVRGGVGVSLVAHLE